MYYAYREGVFGETLAFYEFEELTEWLIEEVYNDGVYIYSDDMNDWLITSNRKTEEELDEIYESDKENWLTYLEQFYDEFFEEVKLKDIEDILDALETDGETQYLIWKIEYVKEHEYAEEY